MGRHRALGRLRWSVRVKAPQIMTDAGGVLNSVGSRLGAAFTALTALTMVCGGTGMWALHQEQERTRALAVLQATAREAERIEYFNTDVSGWQAYVYAQAVTEGAASLQTSTYNVDGLAASRKDGDALLAGFAAGGLAPREQAALDRVRQLWTEYFRQTDQLLELTRTGTPESSQQAYEVLNGPLDSSWQELNEATGELVELVDARAAAAHEAADAAIARLQLVLLATTVLAVALAAVTAPRVTRSITTRLSDVVGVVRGLAEGRLDQRARTGRQDELGVLASATNESLETFSALVRGLTSDARSLSTSVSGLRTSAAQLSQEATTTSATTAEVAGTTDRISTDIATVAAAGEQMTAAIQSISESTLSASQVAADAVQAADAAQATLERLGASSREIGEVVALITSIAAQTNLLALNATIEAARAGEAGKGFAVVAGEVKELARQTARATEHITAKVSATQVDAEAASTALHGIGQVISRIDALQGTIAAAVEEQAATTAEMVRTVSAVARGSEQIARTVSEVASTAHETTRTAASTESVTTEVATVAASLERAVATFRL
ncbi:methyl-accepting chemotaxis protein [Streptomyces sp. NP160]|uniref:methyl-accepting chemotaxis protein n=1 Tax=Streptomyces sp. NP160 TaxID=2586637 RepID=UPI001119B856|nr:methyl-accepting chemotaxis protein [Streptomyces sp. NP160]TNM67182.1 methyl-accepting chemotaxis protein [Streptomyces sp. NP160]